MAKTLATITITTFVFVFHSGICLDGVNNYSCICNAGFTGRHCDALITSCSYDTCFPGVPCTKNINSVSCGSCPSGFTGDGKNCKGRIENKVVQLSDLIWPMSTSHKLPRPLLKVTVGYFKLSFDSPFQHNIWQMVWSSITVNWTILQLTTTEETQSEICSFVATFFGTEIEHRKVNVRAVIGKVKSYPCTKP